MERAVLDGVQQAVPERQCITEAAGAAVFGGRLRRDAVQCRIGQVVKHAMHEGNQPLVARHQGRAFAGGVEFRQAVATGVAATRQLHGPELGRTGEVRGDGIERVRVRQGDGAVQNLVRQSVQLVHHIPRNALKYDRELRPFARHRPLLSLAPAIHCIYTTVEMYEIQAIAESAQALADETRVRLLAILRDGDATVNDLAARVGIAQPRVSTHLALLRRAGLVSAVAAGRQRTYHVDAERIGALFAAFGGTMATATMQPKRSAEAARAVQRDMPIRQARTCYDHLAGVAGVQLLDALLTRGWLIVEDGPRPRYRLTPAGEAALRVRGVDIEAAHRARRLFAFGCLDWTERRPHLGGALGAAILASLEGAGAIQCDRAGRTVLLTKPLDMWLDG
jgi:DNA-binding transcriptional ArsR family regulator